MHLHRVTPDAFENHAATPRFLGTASDDFRVDTLQFDGATAFEVVVTRFPRFGGGNHRQSDFEIYVEWKDAERIIEKFCEAKHPEAIALREARKLGTTIKGIRWREPDTAY